MQWSKYACGLTSGMTAMKTIINGLTPMSLNIPAEVFYQWSVSL